MALAHLSVRAHSRTRGHTVAAALAYRMGLNLHDCRDGTRFDFRWRALHREILATGFLYGQRPAWAGGDPQMFADALERAETRVNSCIARDIEISLPHELTFSQIIKLVKRFARILTTRHKCAVAFAIHASAAEGDVRNVHAHLLISTRSLDDDGQLGEKIRAFHGPAGIRGGQEIRTLRRGWEKVCNKALYKANSTARIDMGRKKGGRAARHLGHRAMALERKLSRQRHEGKRKESLPERASAAALVTENEQSGGCATDRGTQLARHVAEQQLIDQLEQVAAADEIRIQLIEAQPEPNPTPIGKRRRRPRRERAPRQPRVRTRQRQQQPADVERADPQPEPPGASETPAGIPTIEPVAEPRPMPIVAQDAAPKPPTRIRRLQPTPEPRPFRITDAQVAGTDEVSVQLIEVQPESEPTPIRKRRRQLRRERAPRQLRVRTRRREQQPADVECADPQAEPPGASEAPAGIPTIEPVAEPRPIPIAAQDVAPELPTRIQRLQPTPEPQPLSITDAEAALEAPTRVAHVESPDIGTLDRLLRAVREQIRKLQAHRDRARPAAAAFQGRGTWPNTQRRFTAAWAAFVRAAESHAEVEPIATVFMTPAESMRLFKEIAAADVDKALKAEQRRAPELDQTVRFDLRNVPMRFVADRCWFDTAGLMHGQMRVQMCAWTRRHVSQLPLWAKKRIAERCRALDLPEDTVPTIRIPVGLTIDWDARNPPVPVTDCVGHMRRLDETGKLPELQGREQIKWLPAAARTLDEIYHATYLPDEDRAVALNEAMSSVIANRTLLWEGTVFALPAIEVDSIASQALGKPSLKERFFAQPTPRREPTGAMRPDTDRRALYPMVRLAAERILQKIDRLDRPDRETEEVRRSTTEIQPATGEIQAIRAHLDARLPNVLETIGRDQVGGNWIKPPGWHESGHVRRQFIAQALREDDPESAPLIRSPESEEIAAALIDEQLRLTVLEQFADERPPAPPQAPYSEATRQWHQIITRGFTAWKALVPQLARGIRNAITRLEVFALREQAGTRQVDASSPQRPGPNVGRGPERD